MNPNLLVYVAGPFSAKDREGVEANIRAAVDVGLGVAMYGAAPVVPHANTAHPKYEALQEYEFWILATAAMLRACHVLVVVPGWAHSSGACGEVDIALLRGMPVLMSPADLVFWAARKAHPWMVPGRKAWKPFAMPAAFLEAA